MNLHRTLAARAALIVAVLSMGGPRASAPALAAIPTYPIATAAPEFPALQWLNLRADAVPPKLVALRGRVVLVEFWTFACGNCRNVEPHVKSWQRKFSPKGLVVLGVHTPELPHERARANVEAYLAKQGIDWPVALDPDFATWRRWKQGAWPAVYLVDRKGVVRYARIGEGAYERTEAMIAELLAEE